MSDRSSLPAIKPCPFCGHAASVEETADDGYVRFTVGCDNPNVEDCMGYQSLSTYDRRSEAIEAWNRRAPNETRDDLVNALEEARAALAMGDDGAALPPGHNDLIARIDAALARSKAKGG